MLNENIKNKFLLIQIKKDLRANSVQILFKNL